MYVEKNHHFDEFGQPLPPDKYSPRKSVSPKKEESLRVRLFSSLLTNKAPFLRECEFREVRSAREFRLASHLVYLEYLKKQYSIPNRGQLRISIHQALKKTTTFIAIFKKKYILGTMTFVEDSPLGVPMDKLYQDDLDKLRKVGTLCAEATMLALNNKIMSLPSVPKSFRMFILLHLFQAGFRYLRAHTFVDTVVACFHPRHEFFYKMMKFKPLGPIHSYASVRGSPAVAYALHIEQAAQEVPPPMKNFFGVNKPRTHVTPYQRSFSLQLDDFGAMFIDSASNTTP